MNQKRMMLKKAKRIMATVLVVLLFAQLPLTVSAATVSGGTCGANLTWTLDDQGTLTISGTGAMSNWDDMDQNLIVPWNSYKNSVKSVVIEEGVTTIGDKAFLSCANLLSVTIPNSVTTIGEYAFCYCSRLTSVTIPGSVITIGDSAFEWCGNLTSVTIGDGVATIGDCAFYYCPRLTSVDIPDSVTIIGGYAFMNCAALTSVTMGNSVTAIGNYAFNACRGLTSITIPDSVTTIGEGAFGQCNGLASVTIGNGVVTIGYYAFSDCSGLTSIAIPGSATSIDETAFNDCDQLTAIHVDENNQNYSSSDGVLFNKDKTELVIFPCGKSGDYTIPSGVTTIGNYAFECCDNLTSITIPNGVTTIGMYAFTECRQMTSITISNSVVTIGNNAFFICNKLKDVYYGGSESQRNQMAVSFGNEYLEEATWHYDRCPNKEMHTYDDACDTSCNGCGATRAVNHTFGAYIYNKDATASEDGTQTRTCGICGEPETIIASGTKLVDSSKAFTDIRENEWYKPYVDYVVTFGLMNGTGDGQMAPERAITRAEFVQLLANISGIDTSNVNVSTSFDDVESGEWYAPAIKWASENGLVNGISSTEFAPNDQITREQMCTLLVRYIENYLHMTIENINAQEIFADDAMISSWARESVYKCQAGGLVSGVSDTEFAPIDSADRAEVATLMTRFHKKYL